MADYRMTGVLRDMDDWIQQGIITPDEIVRRTLECMCTNPITPNQPTNTTTSSQLGLTQAQQRIESLGGSLHITHTLDRWTTIFTIPLHPTPGTAPPAEAHRHSIAQ